MFSVEIQKTNFEL